MEYLKRLISFIRHNYQEIYKIMLFVFCIVVVVLIYPKEGKYKYEFSLNKLWMQEDLYSPFDFPVYKEVEELQKEKEEANERVHAHFIKNTDLGIQSIKTIGYRFDTLWMAKYGLLEHESYLYNRKVILESAFNLLQRGIILIPKEVKEQLDDESLITLIENKEAKNIFLSHFIPSQELENVIRVQLSSFEKIETAFLRNLLRKHLKANIFYDKEKTDIERDIIIRNISPTVGKKAKGELIISKGEMVDPQQFRVLNSLKREYEGKTGKSINAIVIGQIILVAIPLFAFILFLIFFRKDIFEDNSKLVFILFMNIIIVLLARMLVNMGTDYIYALPLMLVAIMIRAFFDTRLALIVLLISLLLVSFMVPNSFEFIFLQLITGIITIVSIVKLQRRAQFFLTTIYIFISYSIIYIGMVLIQEGGLRFINMDYFIYFGVSALSGLFAYPLIYLFEKIFGFITDVSLLEYADTNQPLLRELASKAPGTFQHSIQMANMAEEASLAVNGNALLTRAGALYHDIGKMENPMFFTENQNGAFNPHEELTYQESARIVIDHVLDGVEIARKNRIPEQIIDFIRTHHGTKRTEYFYRKAIKEFPDEEINPEDYTYHGPVPFTKETSILMMADAVEAASRSISKPNEENIKILIDKIIQSQINDGQFENANLTFRDINTVKQIFAKKLMNIYHVRIAYPE